MKTAGKISKLLPGNVAEVICEPNDACEKCKGCAMSSSGEIIVRAKNSIGAGAGDRVEIEIPEGEGIRAALMVFILPVIGLLAGYFFGKNLFLSESYGIIFALVFMALTFLALSVYDKYLSSKKECKASIIKKA